MCRGNSVDSLNIKEENINNMMASRHYLQIDDESHRIDA